MIRRITDISSLSGVSSPLLPLVYSDHRHVREDTDGVYIQEIDGNITLAISKRNGSANVLGVSDSWDKDELFSFISFAHISCITADIMLDESFSGYCLMEAPTAPSGNSCIKELSSRSSVDEYKTVHELLKSDGDDFSHWYPSFSAGINDGTGAGVYTSEEESCALCTAIYGGMGVVSGVFTKPQFRGMGKGRECVRGLLGVLYNMDVSHALLWCEDKNIAFYKKSGFSVAGKIFYREETE